MTSTGINLEGFGFFIIMESIVKKILNFTKLVGISICCLDLQENRKNEGSFKDAFERDFVLKMPVF